MEIYAMHYNALNTGKRIQKLRKDKGLTQEQLAERLNLSTVHMAKIKKLYSQGQKIVVK